MKINVLFFATLKDRAGRDRLPLELDDGATVSVLKSRLAEDIPALATALPTVLVSVNHEFAFPQDSLKDGDEIALFPPVSGGSTSNPQSPTSNLQPPTSNLQPPTSNLQPPIYNLQPPILQLSSASPTTRLTSTPSSPPLPSPPPARRASSPAWCAG